MVRYTRERESQRWPDTVVEVVVPGGRVPASVGCDGGMDGGIDRSVQLRGVVDCVDRGPARYGIDSALHSALHPSSTTRPDPSPGPS